MRLLLIKVLFASTLLTESPGVVELPLGPSHVRGVTDRRIDAQRRALENDDGPTVDVIIELRDAPLFAAARRESHAGVRSPLRAHLDQLAVDLRRIEQNLPSASKAPGQTQSAPGGLTRIRRTYSRVFAGASVRVRKEMLAPIRSLPYVAAVHFDTPVHALLDESVARIKANLVWAQYGTKGRGVVVAVIDTGIDYNHPALGGGFGPGFKVIGGWDFVNDDSDPMDDQFHGTHVAGIIAANGEALAGVAPLASLLSYKALDKNGGGMASDIIAAIERTVDPNQDGDPSDHADVANLSLGGPGQPGDPMSQAVENAVASGVVFCIAAGNTGNFRDIQSPGLAPSAITVGATSLADAVASFSSSGPSKRTQLIKPEVVAPGVGIVSTTTGGGTLTLSGTSMATPHVSGVAALVKSLHGDWSPADVKAAIVTSAEPLAEEVMAAGGGRVDALRAVAVDVLATPSVTFGIDDSRQDVWSATAPIAIRNASSLPITLVATLDGMREGVVIVADPASVTLGPGEVQSTTITLTVTNAAVPAPQYGSLSFGGKVSFTGGSVPIHVPWAFVKAAELNVHYEDPATAGIYNAIYLSDVVPSDGFIYEFAFGDVDLSLTTPIRSYDIVFEHYPSGSTSSHNVIVLENQNLAGITDLRLSPEMAPFTVTLSAKDEKGGDLETPGRLCAVYNGLLLERSGTAFEFGAPPYRPNRFSAVSPAVTLYATEDCNSGYGLGSQERAQTVYVAQGEPVHGLQSSVVLPAASPWFRQDFRVLPQPAAATGLKLWGIPCWRQPSISWCSFPLYLLGPLSLTGGVETGTLFLTYDRSPDRSAAAFVELSRFIDQTRPPDDLLFSPPIWARDGDVVLDRWRTPSPNSYRAPRGTVLTVGDSPIHPQSGIGRIQDQFSSQIFWYGPIGELRPFDRQIAEETLFDSQGNAVRSGQLSGAALSPGQYQVQSINRNYRLDGVTGKATFTASFDTRLAESWPPQWTALRILDAAGVQSSIVAPGSAATLRFSAIDLSETSQRVAPIRDEATRVEYRAHGTGDWHPLTPVIDVRDYLFVSLDPGHAETGTLFHVDLSPVTTRMEGLIDLRLRAEDPSGNSIELLLEPAFSIGFAGRRRAIRH